jgi:hypothetical protein
MLKYLKKGYPTEFVDSIQNHEYEIENFPEKCLFSTLTAKRAQNSYAARRNYCRTSFQTYSNLGLLHS